MRYCNKCNVTVENNLDNCPLCKQKIYIKNEEFEKDFPLQTLVKEDSIQRAKKILIFVFIFLFGLNVIFNVIFSFRLSWVPYSLVVLWYVYLIIKVALKSYKNIGSIVMVNVYMLSIISFILDLILGFPRWSVNYFIPLVILAGIMALAIFVFIKPTSFLTYFIYMLIIALFGLILLIFLWTRLATVTGPCIVTAFISLMAIIGMFIFGDKNARHEFIKRFHF